VILYVHMLIIYKIRMISLLFIYDTYRMIF